MPGLTFCGLFVGLAGLAGHAIAAPIESGMTYSVRSNGGKVGITCTLRAGQVLPLRENAGGRDIAWEDGELAVGMYNATFSTLGWDILEIRTNPAAADSDAAQAAGFFEGKATIAAIESNALNSGVPSTKLSPGLEQFLATNAAFVSQMVKLSLELPKAHPDRRIWYHVDLVNTQLAGMYAGYLAARAENEKFLLDAPLTAMELLLMNIGGDLEDLDGVGTCNVSSTDTGAAAMGVSPEIDPGHCSALVRLVAGNADVFVAQDTWSSLNSMLRIYKLYDFPFKLSSNEAAAVPATAVSFSSYPAALASGDDFYVLSSGLIEMETTIGNSNPALAARFISPLSVLEWIRNIVANRLAASCTEWPDYYRRFNSGTYNNMNMCFDYNLFKPGKPLADGTFIIAEQIPGFLRVNDLSAKLDNDRFFGSYNVAYDEFIRGRSGADINVEKYGGWFSYNETARAKIFKRDAPKVDDMGDMRKLMRSCEYTTDPLSTQLDSCKYRGWTNCTPSFTAENCIATRGDLNPSTGVFAIDAYGHRNHVATDSKISQYSTFNRESLPADIVSGPVGSSDNAATPDFVWSTSTFSALPHHGMPDRMVFPWQHVEF
jgi:hypothetical protein